jgi:hypothetical protein
MTAALGLTAKANTATATTASTTTTSTGAIDTLMSKSSALKAVHGELRASQLLLACDGETKNADVATDTKRFGNITASIVESVMGKSKYGGSATRQLGAGLASVFQVYKFTGRTDWVDAGKRQEDSVTEELCRVLTRADPVYCAYRSRQPPVLRHKLFPCLAASPDASIDRFDGETHEAKYNYATAEIKTWQSPSRIKSKIDRRSSADQYYGQNMLQMNCAFSTRHYLAIRSQVDMAVFLYNYRHAADWWNHNIDALINVYTSYMLWFYEPDHPRAKWSKQQCRKAIEGAYASNLLDDKIPLLFDDKNAPKPMSPEYGKQIRTFLDSKCYYIHVEREDADTDTGAERISYAFCNERPAPLLENIAPVVIL